MSDKPKKDDKEPALRESRPSQRSFSTSDDGDTTPLPPPTPDEMTPDPRLALPVLRPTGLDLQSAAEKAIANQRKRPPTAKTDLKSEPEAKTEGKTDAKSEPAAKKKTDTKAAAPDAWDRVGAWFIAHGAPYAVYAITLGVFLIHAHLFTGETAGDDLSFHFAESARIADCLRHLDFDLWNPSANGGYASAYYYQVLPQLASALPAAIFGHHLFWFQLSVVLPHVLAPLAAYRGMRLLGATPWQAAVAAFCVGFMNGESRWGAGNAGTFQVGLYTQTWALCAFPLALGHASRWLEEGTNLASAIAWGAFVFLCHPFAGITLGLAVLAAWFAQPVLWLFDQVFKFFAPMLRGHGAWLEAMADRWEKPPKREMVHQLLRGGILAVGLAITWLPVILPLVIDREGFGGFPHRVADEVGPGFKGLWKWTRTGQILDWINPKDGHRRFAILTLALPVVVLFARAKFYRWLWAPGLVFALLLGSGPHIGKIGDDLFPPVRFLGGLQTVAAMGIGAGVILIGKKLWELAGKLDDAYWLRTGLAAIGAALVVLVAVPGTWALSARVRVLEDVQSSHPDELFAINKVLAQQPQGRKYGGPGAENHWWNLLSYAYDRVPATIQMGGGGLQASPNYDFLWTQRDYAKTAWIFDAPYVVLQTSVGGSKVPEGEVLLKTENYELRKLPSPGIISPVHVTGTLPPGYRHDQPGHKAALEWIRSEQPMKDEVLAYAGSPTGLSDAPAGHTIRAWRQDSPGDDADIVGEVEVEKPTTFTVRESWHPRWHAYLDGKEVSMRRVTPDFPAVDVPAGKHVIEMRFERPWWMLAAWLAWPLVSLAAWFALRRRKPATS